MSDNKLTDGRGLYQLPDQPEPPPLQGSVSAPVSALGRADAPLRECPFCGGKADLHIDGLYNVVIECEGCHGVYTGWPLRSQLLQAWNRRDGEAARVAEAVAAAVLEREREIVAVIAGLPRHSDRAGRRMISWFDVQMILRGIESEASAGPQGATP
jgi:hypothetical protein